MAQNTQAAERETFSQRLKGIRQEMKKVVWPTREELGNYAVVVILTCVVFALLFWGVDSAVLAALRSILGANV